MLCICCFLHSKDRKKFCSFSAADRKLHEELTKLEIKLEKSKLFICKGCKIKLKASAEFYRICVRSHEQLNITSEQEAAPAKESRTRKVLTPPPEEVAEYPSSDDDGVPISTLKQLLLDENRSLLSTVKSEVPTISHIIVEKITETRKVDKFLCTECGIFFSSAQCLQEHSITHSGPKTWKCRECDKVFATKFRLKAHTRIHTGERPFVCEICSLSFAQGNALTCHRRVHTKERPFVCKICSKSFSQNTTLKTHMAALHLGKSVACDEPGCDKKFTRRSYLLIHKRDHAGERRYACDRCTNQYKQKSHLDRHIEASHLGIRHRCDFPGCSSEFSKKWSLKMHKFVHASQLPYKCNLCDTAFQRRDKLVKHRIKSHPDAVELISNPLEIHQPTVKKVENLESSDYVVLSSTPEIYTIQNSDGTFTQLHTVLVHDN